MAPRRTTAPTRKGSKPCPECGENACGVLDSRPSKVMGVLWRRLLSCSACGHRFSTQEVIIREDGKDAIVTPPLRATLFEEEIRENIARIIDRHFGANIRKHVGSITSIGGGK